MFKKPGGYLANRSSESEICGNNKHTTHTAKFTRPISRQGEPVKSTNHTQETSVPKNASENIAPASSVYDDELIKLVQALELSKEAKRNEGLKRPKLFRTENVSHEILQHKRSLPIYSVRDDLLELVENNQFVIVVGETGSGKSSQIPQYLAEAGINSDGLTIGITQPRRVAAKSLAERVAMELGVKLGSSVGFAVRFESCISSKTILKYMTDGLLVKDCIQAEPDLDSYSVIMIDEAHERSIHTDVCFGLLKRIARKRPNLKVIISSATLEDEKFSKFFDDAPVFKVAGKSYDVDVIYEPSFNYMQSITNTILKLHQGTRSGDILVFLTGQDEIETVFDSLEHHSTKHRNSLEMIVVPCYGTLPFEEQQKIFDATPPGYRKIVLATNVAETSVTIDGIVFVIDCGYVKERRYNYSTKIETLVKVPITKFQAIQRQGRAGRTQPGKCYRLYSEEMYQRFKDAPVPDIQRSNVESVVLDLLAMGVTNPLKFDFVDPPATDAIGEALIALKDLSAVDDKLSITPLGRQMSYYPLDPPLAKVLIASADLGCSKEVLKIVSLLSTQHQHLFIRKKRNDDIVFSKRQRFHAAEGDHLTFLKIYDEWVNNKRSEEWCEQNFIQFRFLAEAEEIRDQLKNIMIDNRLLTKKGDEMSTCKLHQLRENICKAFTAGYFFQLARKRSTYAYEKLSSSGERKDLFLHPSSSLFKKQPLPEWVIFHEVMETSKAYMVGVVETKWQWIKEYSPAFFAQLQKNYPQYF
ncbi:hypothetical protein HA402_011089 [Bradysia odoriphaga]|nr:hypothetical protein HA402_011089 [Bradysia odoriphaga]